MKIPVVTGPTASGKSAAVMALAEKYNIEIISADAYQVYKYMDIGTAKPAKSEMEAVPHHLIDILTPDKTYSAGDFFEHAEKIIPEIIGRGNIPVIAGGTGLYVQTLTKGIFDAPSRNDELREKLRTRGEAEGYDLLHHELENIDAEFAAKIEKTDKVRIIRGLEINSTLGMTVSAAQEKYHRNPKFDYGVFVLTMDREKLYERINMRVDDMFAKGWADEVRRLIIKGYGADCASFKAIGYREIADCIIRNETADSMREKIKQKTRNFAKRQLTWFRHMENICCLDAQKDEIIENISKLIDTN